MTDICSIWAYEDIKRSGYLKGLQARVLKIFSENPNKTYTGTQIVEITGRASSENIRNRITELEQKGFLKKTDEKIICNYTKKRVNVWQYTGRKIPKIPQITRCACPSCKGRGYVDKTVYVDQKKQGELF